MSPESVNFFGIAERKLKDAQRAFATELDEASVREAYLVALSATRAIIFEKTGTAPKTHSGARTQLSKMVHDGLAFDHEFVLFLSRGFEVKSDFDYGEMPPVSKASAEQALNIARAFIAAAKAVCK